MRLCALVNEILELARSLACEIASRVAVKSPRDSRRTSSSSLDRRPRTISGRTSAFLRAAHISSREWVTLDSVSPASAREMPALSSGSSILAAPAKGSRRGEVRIWSPTRGSRRGSGEIWGPSGSEGFKAPRRRIANAGDS